MTPERQEERPTKAQRALAEELWWQAGAMQKNVALPLILAALEQTRREGLHKIEQWATVAFYPGPNENPHFQAGYMKAVHEAARVVARLLSSPPEAAGTQPQIEYGQQHPWPRFDEWHKVEHEAHGYAWPCAIPLRCLWRYLRKTDYVLTQEGQEARHKPGAAGDRYREGVEAAAQIVERWHIRKGGFLQLAFAIRELSEPTGEVPKENVTFPCCGGVDAHSVSCPRGRR